MGVGDRETFFFFVWAMWSSAYLKIASVVSGRTNISEKGARSFSPTLSRLMDAKGAGNRNGRAGISSFYFL